MPYVLDATAIRAGLTTQDRSIWFTTPSVLDEIKKGRVSRDLELAVEISITVKAPGADALAKVREAAAQTGDVGRLSGTDTELLALALELGATLVSDDYSVQNVATVLKIPYETQLGGIRKVIHWTYRCKGCGKYYDEMQPDCPICGAEVRTVRRKG